MAEGLKVSFPCLPLITLSMSLGCLNVDDLDVTTMEPSQSFDVRWILYM